MDAMLPSPDPVPVCAKCGATGSEVRIYREYGSFRRPETDRCNDCIETTAWRVPCILDKDGRAWGYTSVPEDACQRFFALPDKAPDKPGWAAGKGCWSDSEILVP